MTNYITLDEVGDVYPGYGLPEVAQASHVRRTVDDLLSASIIEVAAVRDTERDDSVGERSAFDVLRAELIEIGRSLRSSSRPRTALHVLLYADRLSVGQIAGRLHVDPREVEATLERLVGTRIVHRDATGAIVRYSIIGLSGE